MLGIKNEKKITQGKFKLKNEEENEWESILLVRDSHETETAIFNTQFFLTGQLNYTIFWDKQMIKTHRCIKST